MARDPIHEWLKRNWKWFLPAAFVTASVGFAAFALAILALIFGAMKASDPYKQALVLVQQDQTVERELGWPIEAGWWVGGNINVNGASGYASLYFPVAGSAAEGRVYLEAAKAGGRWTFRYLAVEADANPQRITLISGDDP